MDMKELKMLPEKEGVWEMKVDLKSELGVYFIKLILVVITV